MKKAIVAVVIFALAAYFAIPLISSGKVVWWGILLYIAWFVLVLYVIYRGLRFLRQYVSRSFVSNRDKMLGYHEFSKKITDAKYLIRFDALRFAPDNFTRLKGVVKRGRVKVDDFISIYDTRENFVCRVKIQKLVISYNEVKFADAGDTVEIYVNPSILNETSLPAGSVAIKS